MLSLKYARTGHACQGVPPAGWDVALDHAVIPNPFGKPDLLSWTAPLFLRAAVVHHHAFHPHKVGGGVTPSIAVPCAMRDRERDAVPLGCRRSPHWERNVTHERVFA